MNEMLKIYLAAIFSAVAKSIKVCNAVQKIH